MIGNKNCRWLNINSRSLVSRVTALPTKPQQPLPKNISLFLSTFFLLSLQYFNLMCVSSFSLCLSLSVYENIFHFSLCRNLWLLKSWVQLHFAMVKRLRKMAKILSPNERHKNTIKWFSIDFNKLNVFFGSANNLINALWA